MRTHTSEVNRKNKTSLDRLIAVEWDIMRDLRKMLRDGGLSPGEKTRVANSLAYHASVLNKLLSQKCEDQQFNEKTLGDFIKDIEPKTARRVFRDVIFWTRRLSLKE